MSVRPTKTAFGLAAGAAVLFAVGTNVQAGWLLVLAASLLGTLAAGAVLPLRALRGIEVTRTAPAEARAGSDVTVRLVVSNTTRATRGLILVRDDFLAPGCAVVTTLRGGRTIAFEGIRRNVPRGVHTSGRCELLTGAPFGVVHVRRVVEVPGSTVVYPRVFAAPLGDTAGAGGAASAHGRRAPSGDTAAVRPYRHGDALRHVHWRTSARAGQLVVREFEDDLPPPLLVVADVGIDGGDLDTVASCACSIALTAIDEGRDVRLADLRSPSRRDVLAWGAALAPGDGDAAARALRDAPPAGTVAAVLATGNRDALRAASALAASRPVTVFLVGRDGRGAPETGGLRVVRVGSIDDPGSWLHASVAV